MKQPIEAILFDLDGTLLDTAEDFTEALNQLRQEDKLNTFTTKQIRPYVSNGAYGLVRFAYGEDLTETQYQTLRQRLLESYNQHLCAHSKPFAGIKELLLAIEAKNLPWGIVTNKPSAYAKPLMAKQTFAKKSKVLICPDQLKASKPSPEGLLLACKQLSVKPSRCIYIGDHRRDIEAGNHAGMVTLAAAYGYLVEPDADPNWWQADEIVNTPEAILDWLEANHWQVIRTN